MAESTRDSECFVMHRRYSGGIKCYVDKCNSRSRIRNKKTCTKFIAIRTNEGIRRYCEEHNPRRKNKVQENKDQEVNNVTRDGNVKKVEDHTYSYNGDIEKFKALQKYDHELEKNVHNPCSEVQKILCNKYYLNFYTGFADQNQFLLFTEMIVEHNKKYKHIHQSNDNCQHVLNNETQLFKTSTWFITRRFGLEVLPIWPSKETVQNYMPECFKKRYPSTRIILDGTELFIQKPSDYVVQSSTYSTYKAHNTARGIVGVTPNGFVCFVSDLYPGRTTEKEVILRSGLLKKLNPGDSVMADRGFPILEELRAVDADLNIPPFARGIQQFNNEDEQRTRDIASIRIHVERAIRNIKIFRILNMTIPNNMADQLNEVWNVCCYLTNVTRIPLLNR